MANTIARTILEDGPRNAVVLFTLIGDGSGQETDALVLDYSALSPEPGSYYVKSVQAGTVGAGARLSFDATTNVPFMSLGADVWTKYNGAPYAGISYTKVVNGAAGANGDIVLATHGLAAGHSISIVITIVKGGV